MGRILFQVRNFHSKSALLILVWTVFPFTVLESPIFYRTSDIPYIIVMSLLFPIAGFVSDVFLSRHSVIRYSLRLSWLLLLLYYTLLTLQQYVWEFIDSTYLEIFKFLTFIGVAGVLTNTFQFGIDQLIDASSSDITSYISWYMWTFFCVLAFIPLVEICSCGTYYNVAANFILPLLCTFAIVTDCLCDKSFIKEPIIQNPYKLIYRVLKYAVKNKHPRLRSAFTYWEEEPISRLDLGKTKYGGPFTTEQVEDVKTFFRLSGVILAAVPYAGIIFLMYFWFLYFKGFYRMGFLPDCSDTSVTEYLSRCFQQSIIQYSTPTLMVFVIPFIEFLLYPFMRNCYCTTKLRIKHKIIFGTFLLIAYEVLLVSFEMASVSINTYPQNFTCIFYENQIEDIKLDYKWLVLFQPVLGMAVYILGSSFLEFVCAQSPYSMKGLLVGIFWTANGASLSFFTELIHVLQASIKSLGKKCVVWLYIAVLSMTTILICIQFVTLKCYKLRKRDDILRNDQMFAVNYFSKYLARRPLAVCGCQQNK